MSVKTELLEDGAGVQQTSVQEIRDHIDHHPQPSKGVAGVGFDFCGALPPHGSLSCDGQEVSQALYPALYAVIGDLWATTGGVAAPAPGDFRLPPQENNGLGLYIRGVGTTNGPVGTYQEDTIKEHVHPMNHSHSATCSTDGRHTHTLKSKMDSAGGASRGSISSHPTYDFPTNAAGEHSHNITVNSFNGNSGNYGDVLETRPRSVIMLRCIWTGE